MVRKRFRRKERRVVAGATETALNELFAMNCDQDSLAITDVQSLKTLTTQGGGCAGTRYLYSVDFKCRDCLLDSKLSSDSRRMEERLTETRVIDMSCLDWQGFVCRCRGQQ